ncbi:hypothetical protein VTN77DRAFT_9474 [Rasamsonia byssochlamydoides]|uniref:uncharacterized protein n=1 Tax=Rasamsonia byssochlamydoides TaxID=89139 RepID=UPI003742C041
MTRPQMIRADTIDLQDPHAPSAQDHKHPTRIGTGRPAPHQSQSLLHAEQESREELSHLPRLSDDRLDSEDQHHGIDIIYDEPEDMMADMAGDSQSGHYSGEEGDLADGEGDDILDDDLMDKISSSPSIDDEDIDFEFVYALHTFVATVEGQANATKGDTMVLLDDSNSYWWLVRIVKDGTIGYLPAEHIETPTERLARLNKHRNIDLSASMLGDNPEKSKNPLKKAMRRRNAKTVTFSSPTYFEASDVDYSSSEEEQGDGENQEEEEEEERSRADSQDTQDEDIRDESIVVEPLRPKPHKEKTHSEPEVASEDQESDRASPEKPRTSDEILDRQDHFVSRSRNGTLRNTDSFFKDDTVETKKISLTPNLLRDDSSTSVLSSETKEGRSSLEYGDKGSGEKSKRKDKKSGMLSGLFKRKDKKGKVSEDDAEEPEKTSEESARSSPQPKLSSESLQESRNTKTQGPQRQSSRLQKQPPVELQQNRWPHEPVDASSPTKEDFGPSIRRVVSPESADVPAPLHVRSPELVRGPRISPPSDQSKADGDASSPVKSIDSASPTEITSRSNDNVEREESADISSPISQSRSITSPVQQFPQRQTLDRRETLSESPVSVSPVAVQAPSHPPGLMVDTSSQDERSISPLSPPSSSPELVDAADSKVDDTTPVSTVSSAAHTSWSDASLRSYLDDENDIRDLLIIVHDKSNVQPAGPDHPITGSLFKEESKRLKELSNQLDEMLSSWIARKLERRLNKSQ